MRGVSVTRNSSLFWRVLVIGVLFLFLAGTTFLILSRPDQISDRLLRIGGRIVNRALSNLENVAFISGIGLLLLWGGLAIATVREPRRKTDPLRPNEKATSHSSMSP